VSKSWSESSYALSGTGPAESCCITIDGPLFESSEVGPVGRSVASPGTGSYGLTV
jgi:hypothetical protein